MSDAPKDVVENYAAGTAVVTTYQTTGVSADSEKIAPSQGQADGYAVVTSRGAIDEAAMNHIMDGLSDTGNRVTNGDFARGSTGALVAVSQVSAAVPGGASFDVVAGSRGDSQTFIAKVDAENHVSLIDFNSRMKPPENPMGSLGFGAEGERGGNELGTQRVDLKPGERAFVFTASDGAIDPHIEAASRAGGGRGAYVQQMQGDLQSYVSANPQSQDISRFLAERATTLGTQDNTTIASVKLDAHTDLKGNSVTMAVFDGTGHEDGTLSSALAKSVEAEVPGGQKPQLISRQELEHVSTRAGDLARTATPGTPDPHAAGTSTPAPAAGAPNTSQPSTTAEEVHPAPPKSKFTSAPQGNAPSAVAKASTAAGHGVGAARVGVDIAEGNYKQAGIDTATQVALTPATYKAAAALTEETGTVAKALGFFGKKIPIVGAVVTAGFVAYEVGSNVYQGNYGKAAAAAGAGAAEALGNVVGFGVGDLAREGVREGVVLTAGENYAPEKSGLRTLAERGVEVGSKFLSSDAPKVQEAVVRNNPPATRPIKPPSMT